MANLCNWLGGTEGNENNFNTATNWSTVPADGDTLMFNDLSTASLLDNIAVAAMGFDVIATSGFKYAIGTLGTEFTPANGLGTIIWSGTGIAPSYFEVPATKFIGRCLVNTNSNKDDLVQLSGAGKITQLTVMNGRVLLNEAILDDTDSRGRVQVLGGLGSENARLSISPGCTLTGSTVTISGGKLITATTLVDFVSTGGETVLNTAAGVSGTYEQHNGVVWWDAASTIANANVFGGTLAIRKDRVARTLTAGSVYPGGTIDFRTGNFGVTFTNALRNLGGSYLYPVGSSVTAAM